MTFCWITCIWKSSSVKSIYTQLLKTRLHLKSFFFPPQERRESWKMPRVWVGFQAKLEKQPTLFVFYSTLLYHPKARFLCQRSADFRWVSILFFFPIALGNLKPENSYDLSVLIVLQWDFKEAIASTPRHNTDVPVMTISAERVPPPSSLFLI